jgi:hypothetical protein
MAAESDAANPREMLRYRRATALGGGTERGISRVRAWSTRPVVELLINFLRGLQDRRPAEVMSRHGALK